MLRVTRLSKSFGGQLIFRGVDWFVRPRDRLALVGANGSGKSTLLKIVAGLESPDQGTIDRPKELRIGYLAQAGFALSEATVRAEARRGFDEILALQRELGEVESGLTDGAAPRERLTQLSVRQAEILERLRVLGAHDIDRQIHAVLTGLGFREPEFDRPLATLSGGWQMRAALARVLLTRPQVLLLDEPTNHLDMEAREWLEGYLREYPYAFVLVSHDRYFLDVTVSRVTEIAGQGLEEYAGNYSTFEREREKRLELRRAAYERQQDEIRRVQRFIDRFRAKNTKAVQVQSRIRMLAKMARLAPPEAVRRSIAVPQPPSPRSGKVVLELRRVSKAYGEVVVLDRADLRVVRGGRVALVGPNGAGKSTLMRILAGAEVLDEGERVEGHNLEAAFFAQDHGERLNPRQTVLDAVTSVAPNDFVPMVRGLLGAFLFSGDEVDKPVAVLSGGERNRLALARLLVRPSNLLLLDEPTNHLDIASKDVLLEALRKYGGTVVFVSHDRHFVASLADHVVEVGGGRLREFPGGYEDFLWKREQERLGAAGDGGPARPAGDSPGPATGAATRAAANAGPGARAREAAHARQDGGVREAASAGQGLDGRRRSRRLGALEDQIAALEDRKRRFSEVMGSPDFFANPGKAEIYLRQYHEVEQELGRLYREWEKLAEEG
jgi:ATP-binding cassette subfamily F protein 3